MTDVLELVAWVINIYIIVLFARFILGLVLSFTEYRPSGAVAVVFEFVYTLTDPPLKLLRRYIPTLRLGSFALDLSFIVLLIGLQIVARQLQIIARG